MAEPVMLISFMTAIQTPGFGPAAGGLAGYRAHAALCTVART